MAPCWPLFSPDYSSTTVRRRTNHYLFLPHALLCALLLNYLNYFSLLFVASSSSTPPSPNDTPASPSGSPAGQRWSGENLDTAHHQSEAHHVERHGANVQAQPTSTLLENPEAATWDTPELVYEEVATWLRKFEGGSDLPQKVSTPGPQPTSSRTLKHGHPTKRYSYTRRGGTRTEDKKSAPVRFPPMRGPADIKAVSLPGPATPTADVTADFQSDVDQGKVSDSSENLVVSTRRASVLRFTAARGEVSQETSGPEDITTLPAVEVSVETVPIEPAADVSSLLARITGLQSTSQISAGSTEEETSLHTSSSSTKGKAAPVSARVVGRTSAGEDGTYDPPSGVSRALIQADRKGLRLLRQRKSADRDLEDTSRFPSFSGTPHSQLKREGLRELQGSESKEDAEDGGAAGGMKVAAVRPDTLASSSASSATISGSLKTGTAGATFSPVAVPFSGRAVMRLDGRIEGRPAAGSLVFGNDEQSERVSSHSPTNAVRSAFPSSAVARAWPDPTSSSASCPHSSSPREQQVPRSGRRPLRRGKLVNLNAYDPKYGYKAALSRPAAVVSSSGSSAAITRKAQVPETVKRRVPQWKRFSKEEEESSEKTPYSAVDTVVSEASPAAGAFPALASTPRGPAMAARQQGRNTTLQHGDLGKLREPKGLKPITPNLRELRRPEGQQERSAKSCQTQDEGQQQQQQQQEQERAKAHVQQRGRDADQRLLLVRELADCTRWILSHIYREEEQRDPRRGEAREQAREAGAVGPSPSRPNDPYVRILPWSSGDDGLRSSHDIWLPHQTDGSSSQSSPHGGTHFVSHSHLAPPAVATRAATFAFSSSMKPPRRGEAREHAHEVGAVGPSPNGPYVGSLPWSSGDDGLRSSHGIWLPHQTDGSSSQSSPHGGTHFVSHSHLAPPAVATRAATFAFSSSMEPPRRGEAREHAHEAGAVSLSPNDPYVGSLPWSSGDDGLRSSHDIWLPHQTDWSSSQSSPHGGTHFVSHSHLAPPAVAARAATFAFSSSMKPSRRGEAREQAHEAGAVSLSPNDPYVGSLPWSSGDDGLRSSHGIWMPHQIDGSSSQSSPHGGTHFVSHSHLAPPAVATRAATFAFSSSMKPPRRGEAREQAHEAGAVRLSPNDPYVGSLPWSSGDDGLRSSHGIWMPHQTDGSSSQSSPHGGTHFVSHSHLAPPAVATRAATFAFSSSMKPPRSGETREHAHEVGAVGPSPNDPYVGSLPWSSGEDGLRSSHGIWLPHQTDGSSSQSSPHGGTHFVSHSHLAPPAVATRAATFAFSSSMEPSRRGEAREHAHEAGAVSLSPNDPYVGSLPWSSGDDGLRSSHDIWLPHQTDGSSSQSSPHGGTHFVSHSRLAPPAVAARAATFAFSSSMEPSRRGEAREQAHEAGAVSLSPNDPYVGSLPWSSGDDGLRSSHGIWMPHQTDGSSSQSSPHGGTHFVSHSHLAPPAVATRAATFAFSSSMKPPRSGETREHAHEVGAVGPSPNDPYVGSLPWSSGEDGLRSSHGIWLPHQTDGSSSQSSPHGGTHFVSHSHLAPPAVATRAATFAFSSSMEPSRRGEAREHAHEAGAVSLSPNDPYVGSLPWSSGDDGLRSSHDIWLPHQTDGSSSQSSPHGGTHFVSHSRLAPPAVAARAATFAFSSSMEPSRRGEAREQAHEAGAVSLSPNDPYVGSLPWSSGDDGLRSSHDIWMPHQIDGSSSQSSPHGGTHFVSHSHLAPPAVATRAATFAFSSSMKPPRRGEAREHTHEAGAVGPSPNDPYVGSLPWSSGDDGLRSSHDIWLPHQTDGSSSQSSPHGGTHFVSHSRLAPPAVAARAATFAFSSSMEPSRRGEAREQAHEAGAVSLSPNDPYVGSLPWSSGDDGLRSSHGIWMPHQIDGSSSQSSPHGGTHFVSHSHLAPPAVATRAATFAFSSSMKPPRRGEAREQAHEAGAVSLSPNDPYVGSLPWSSGDDGLRSSHGIWVPHQTDWSSSQSSPHGGTHFVSHSHLATPAAAAAARSGTFPSFAFPMESHYSDELRQQVPYGTPSVQGPLSLDHSQLSMFVSGTGDRRTINSGRRPPRMRQPHRQPAGGHSPHVNSSVPLPGSHGRLLTPVVSPSHSYTGTR